MSRPDGTSAGNRTAPAGGRPRVGISACLTGAAVRYDGGDKYDGTLCDELSQAVEIIPVCPEVEIGLGVPRRPIYLAGSDDGIIRLVEETTGRDLTERMTAHARTRLADLVRLGLSGFIFKAKSPSCGLQQVPVAGRNTPGRGVFAAVLLECLPDLPAIEAEELTDRHARSRFLDAVFAHNQAGTTPS